MNNLLYDIIYLKVHAYQTFNTKNTYGAMSILILKRYLGHNIQKS
jgi:hypothetical protein